MIAVILSLSMLCHLSDPGVIEESFFAVEINEYRHGVWQIIFWDWRDDEQVKACVDWRPYCKKDLAIWKCGEFYVVRFCDNGVHRRIRTRHLFTTRTAPFDPEIADRNWTPINKRPKLFRRPK